MLNSFSKGFVYGFMVAMLFVIAITIANCIWGFATWC